MRITLKIKPRMRFYFKRHFLSHCLACSTMFSFEMLRNSPFKIKLKQKPKKNKKKKSKNKNSLFIFIYFFSNKKKTNWKKLLSFLWWRVLFWIPMTFQQTIVTSFAVSTCYLLSNLSPPILQKYQFSEQKESK